MTKNHLIGSQKGGMVKSSFRNHSHSVARVVSLMLVSAGAFILVPAGAAWATTDFTSFSPPITGATDFATGFPNNGNFGPIGMIDDGTSFYVSDFANGLLYKFPVTGGDASTVPSAADDLFGLTLSQGTYFGTTFSGEIDTFDPSTLALSPTNATLPCADEGIATDPLSSDLYVGTQCGIYRVQNPTSATPTVTLFSTTLPTDTFDGVSISSDGQDIWAADTSAGNAVDFNRAGAVVATVADPDGLDGIGIAEPGVISGGINVSNNVFINNNDGTITRVDTNNSDATSTVATGGSRGDLAITGPDGCLYATQTDRIEKLAPCFFQPSGGLPPFAPGGGSFVIGDGNSAVGTAVTFWGAQWRKDNSLTDGTAPAAFKGFALHPTTPTCGAVWTTHSGDSAPPPPGPLPPEMAVIVSSTVTKTGPIITGDVAQIVIVKTNPGYEGNPGHPGTGTVVATVC